MENDSHHKRNLIILDFDNTIYINTEQNFTIDINLHKIFPANYFFQQLVSQTQNFNDFEFAHFTDFLLLTGRFPRQKEIILSYLKDKGYKIDGAIFTSSELSMLEYYEENAFKIEYWSDKARILTNLYHSGKYKTITVIDDDEVICLIAKELGLDVIHVQIQQIGVDFHITFHPISQKFNLQLLEQEGIMHG